MQLLIRYFFFFMIYSFIGWVCETAYCSYLEKNFINRGFLNGPFCPIYGVGALIALFTLHSLPQNPVLIFFAGMLLMSAVEYFTGWLLEVIFKTTWWDYSDQKFNIKGRVCLANSICFGLLIVALIFLIHPTLWSLADRLPTKLLDTLSYGLLIYLIIDLTLTLFTILKLKSRLEKLNSLTDALREKLDSYNWYNNTVSIRERLDKLFDAAKADSEFPLYKAVKLIKDNITHIELDNRPLQKRLLQAFPKIKSLKYPEHLNNIRDRILNIGKKG